MKILRTYAASIVALVLAFAINPAFAAQMNQEDASPKANSRYVIKGGEVYDKETALTWQRCSVGQHWREEGGCAGVIKTFTFAEALRQGSGEWRVPTKAELRTLLDYKRGDNHQKPLIDEVSFPDMDENQLVYWTNMPFDAQGWYIRFSDGYVSYSSYRNFVAAVRLVRGGQ
jgi:hypothetical protein